MTNFEMLKKIDIYEMALTIKCPFEAGFIDDYRCGNGKGMRSGVTQDCHKCCLEWLQEDSE